MVLGRLLNVFRGEPQLPPGPTKLPSYFPVEPKGCEHVSQKLFSCVTHEATAKARDLEKAGFHTSYFADVQPVAADARFAKVALENRGGKDDDAELPKPGENPLDQCRSQIAYYRQCCDRELKKKKNWLLTEPYRVQEEYRYGPTSTKQQQAAAGESTAK